VARRHVLDARGRAGHLSRDGTQAGSLLAAGRMMLQLEYGGTHANLRLCEFEPTGAGDYSRLDFAGAALFWHPPTWLNVCCITLTSSTALPHYACRQRHRSHAAGQLRLSVALTSGRPDSRTWASTSVRYDGSQQSLVTGARCVALARSWWGGLPRRGV
jgi:hypothetical protein